MDELSDLFDDFVMPGDDERESYVVTDEPHANRMTRRLHKLRREIAGIEQVRDAEIEHVNRIYSDRVAGADRDVSWIEGQLKSWMRALLQLQPIDRNTGRPKGPKSLKLVGATVKANSKGGQPQIRDREAFQSWAVEHEFFKRDASVELEFDTMAVISSTLRNSSILIQALVVAAAECNAEIPAPFVAILSAMPATAEHLADHVDQACEKQMKLVIPARSGDVPEMTWFEPTPPKDGEEPTEGFWVFVAEGTPIPGLAREEPGYNYDVIPEA